MDKDKIIEVFEMFVKTSNYIDLINFIDKFNIKFEKYGIDMCVHK